MKIEPTDIERIHIKQSDIQPFNVWMDEELIYQKNGKLYQDWVDEDTGEESTIEVKLSDLYDKFKKRKIGKNMKRVNSENFSLKGIFNSLGKEKKIILEDKKYEMVRSETKMEFRKKSNNGLIGTVDMENSKIGNRLPDSGYFKLAAGPLKPYKNKMELNDLVNGLVAENTRLKEGEAKISKGNKSTKNSFGDEKVETPWATGKKDDCCKDYGITSQEAEKKIKDIKSIEKLDEEYQRLFLQMDNEMDRYWFRRCYQEIRNKIGKKEMPKPTVTNKNFK